MNRTKFRRTKGAIKLHLLLDHDGYLPSFAVVTEGKTSEIKVARTLRFAPGTILAIDRGYLDYAWFRELTQEEVYFVTRMKEKAVYEVKEELQAPQNSNVVRDQIICFPRLAREGEEPRPLAGSLTGLGVDRYAVRLAESGCGARNFQAPFARDPWGRPPPRGGRGPLEHRVECA